jgi:hypothetical protein
MTHVAADVYTSARCALHIRAVLRAIERLFHMDQTHGMGGFGATGASAREPCGAAVCTFPNQKIVGFCSIGGRKGLKGQGLSDGNLR